MARKSKPGNSMAVMAGPMNYREPKVVTVERAKNGFVVKSLHESGCTTMVAKNPTEANRHINKLLK